jgi:hypothetical protein
METILWLIMKDVNQESKIRKHDKIRRKIVRDSNILIGAEIVL